MGVNIILPPGTLTIRSGGIKMVQENVQMMWGPLLGRAGGSILGGGGICCVEVSDVGGTGCWLEVTCTSAVLVPVLGCVFPLTTLP